MGFNICDFPRSHSFQEPIIDIKWGLAILLVQPETLIGHGLEQLAEPWVGKQVPRF